MIGPSVNLYVGDSEPEFTYSSDLVSWQVNGQLGYISKRGEQNRANMLGIFGSAGTTNPGVIQLMKANCAALESKVVTENKFNEFYTVEGGIVISGFLRMSGGIGQQAYTYTVSGTTEHGFPYKKNVKGHLDFFSGTLGLVFNLDAVNWVIDANMMTGMDFTHSELRLSTGFVLKF